MLLPLSLGISLAIISVIGLLMNGYILLVVILTKQVNICINLIITISDMWIKVLPNIYPIY